MGLDAAVIDLGDRYLVAKTDPIAFASDWVGWYAVHVNANDVACMGAEPRWFLASLLLPEGKADLGLAETIFSQIGEACRSLGGSLVGGHTEISHGLDRPIVVGCMLGEVAKDGLVTAAGAQVGDVLLLVGGIPFEAPAIPAPETGGGPGPFDARSYRGRTARRPLGAGGSFRVRIGSRSGSDLDPSRRAGLV